MHMLVQGSDVEMWWPNGYGEQPLYHVNVSVSSDVGGKSDVGGRGGVVMATRPLAFRSVNIIAASGNDTHPPVQTYRVNGVDIFAKVGCVSR